jgi:hypothetical protein
MRCDSAISECSVDIDRGRCQWTIEQRSETTWGKCFYMSCVFLFAIKLPATVPVINLTELFIYLFSLTIIITLFKRIITNYIIYNKYEAFHPCLSCCWFLRFRGTTKIHCKCSRKERRKHFVFPFLQLQYINSFISTTSSTTSSEPIG